MFFILNAYNHGQREVILVQSVDKNYNDLIVKTFITIFKYNSLFKVSTI